MNTSVKMASVSCLCFVCKGKAVASRKVRSYHMKICSGNPCSFSDSSEVDVEPEEVDGEDPREDLDQDLECEFDREETLELEEENSSLSLHDEVRNCIVFF